MSQAICIKLVQPSWKICFFAVENHISISENCNSISGKNMGDLDIDFTYKLK